MRLNKNPIKISTEIKKWKVLKMVKKKMYERIQKMKKMGKNKKEIAKELEFDPATVRKYHYMSASQYNSYRQGLSERKKHTQITRSISKSFTVLTILKI